jgi:hypothetical protein
MFETVILGTICIGCVAFFVALLHFARKRGEDCWRYPYDCPYCCHAVECINIIARKNRKERERADRKKN